VVMASYAPLFAHVDAWQWAPDLIWFDNLRAFGTPNYYVQKLFATNLGSRILPLSIDGSPNGQNNEVYATASLDEKTGEVILKVVNSGKTAKQEKISFAGAAPKAGVRAIVLTSDDLAAENSLDQPLKVAPVERAVAANGSTVDITLPGYSLSVLRVPIR
jgi:alpha-L-arabinofuranosidase